MQFKDYYQILGVSRDVSEEDLKKAYRRLARKYHPDVSKEADAETHFKEINEAYEVLKDPEKRAVYDRLGSQYRAGDAFRAPPGWDGGPQFDVEGMGGGFSDFFEALFRGQGRRGGFGGARRGSDQVASVVLSLEEAYRGGQRRISLSGPNGTRTVDVRIPAGVMPGQRIRLAGQGEAGAGGGAGDLYLDLEIAPHPLFRLEGRDIHLDLPVTPWEAVLGATITVPTLGGPVQVQVPPGSQSGRRLRLKGRGFPGSPPGDQYLNIQIQIPPVGSDREKALYEELSRISKGSVRSHWPV
jgi:curved DNA-binding protein